MTSGRTRPEIARDLGIELSPLTRWLSQKRDEIEPGEAPFDLHAELKRLRQENAVLKYLSRIDLPPGTSLGLM